MGASVSGHSSHPEHRARFKRVVGGSRDSAQPLCRMCRQKVAVGAPAYRCSESSKPDQQPDCAVVLHEACYRRPKTLKRHFGHPKHRLTLGGAGLSCSFCARGLGTPPVAYSCTHRSCAGFHAHPSCCDLPRVITVLPQEHEHTSLVLRPASGGNNISNRVARQHQRKCFKCKRPAATGPAAPWSYQCSKCDMEYCLACLLDDDGSAARCCCFQCCNVDDAAVHCVGHVAGVFFCGFLSGMGCPAAPLQTQPYPGDMEPTRY